MAFILSAISSIARRIFRISANFLLLFSSVKEKDMSIFRIYVKLSKDKSVPVDVRPEWTIKNVKEALAGHISSKDLSPDDLRIIFAGKELSDNVIIEDCDMGQHSVIHAVLVKNHKSGLSEDSTSQATCPLNLSLLKLQLPEEEQKLLPIDRRKVNFFIYCSSPCKQVLPGKLRVRCSECKQGTLTVLKDPTCWDDVLEPAKIPGVCQAEGCKGKYAEFYFKCTSHLSMKEDSAVVLYLIKNNFKEVPCLACADISATILVFPCADGHVICLDCFKMYCISHLNDRSFVQDPVLGYTLPCAARCPDSLIKEAHHFHILGDEQYSRYQRFGAEEFVLQAGGVLCPYPSCGAGILVDSECRRVVCEPNGTQGCGFVFCRYCLQGYHIGSCESSGSASASKYAYIVDDAQAEKSRWDKDTERTIKVTTKPCPKCRTPIERDGGCMHIICPRAQCGYQWCWICQSEWTRECMGDHWFG